MVHQISGSQLVLLQFPDFKLNFKWQSNTVSKKKKKSIKSNIALL